MRCSPRTAVTVGLGAILLVGCARRDAEDLLEDVRADDYRNTYERAPGWEDPRLPSDGGPHGSFVDIYINDTLAEALDDEGRDAWPEGSLIVKDGWNDEDGDSLRFIAIMEKRDKGKWFWAEYESNGDVEIAGLDEGVCTGCHEAGQDQVRAFGLP